MYLVKRATAALNSHEKAEVVREKAILVTREEVPHTIAVMVDSFEEADKLQRLRGNDLRGARRAEGNSDREARGRRALARLPIP
jgi:hypothetical protein